MSLRCLLMSLSLGLALAGTASAGFPFGFWRWSGLGYGPGIHAYHCCPTCAAPAYYQGGWVPYGAPMMLEPDARPSPTPAPLQTPAATPASPGEPIAKPAPQAWRSQGWISTGASFR